MSDATKAAAAASFWEERVGSIRVFEHVKRKCVLYLRWRSEGNWAYLSLAKAAERDGFATATLRDVDGKPLAPRELARKKKWALEQAENYIATLRTRPATPIELKSVAPMTLGETWDVISHPETGQYPAATRHRREVERELANAVRILGADLPWNAIKVSQLEKLWRTRIRELRAAPAPDETQIVGLRGAEVSVARVVAIGQWLRDRERIPGDAAIAPSNWRQLLRDDWIKITGEDRIPEPKRPRHSEEEYGKLFAAAWDVDPRMGLMYSLGAELRGGQIRRARRSDLDLPVITDEMRERNDYGRFRAPGRGKKKGAVIVLIKEQRDDIERAMDPTTGYLRELEAAYRRGTIADYFLFPRGQLPGNRTARGVLPVSPTAKRQAPATRDYRTPVHPVATLARHTTSHVGDAVIREWFKKAEVKAGIKEVKGRVWYGTRRKGVDLASEQNISREGMQEHGGWSDNQVPDTIYRDKEREGARLEAANVRSAIRRHAREMGTADVNDGDEQ